MLVVYVVTGIAFMLLPGTFIGVLNMFKSSAAQTSGAADAGWIQAHCHAQIFGWLGTFILAIGYYAIPRLRLSAFSSAAAWTTYGFWTAGVAMRWATGTWPTPQWRILFPLAGVLDLIAVAVFAVVVFLARPRTRENSWRTSILILTAAGIVMGRLVDPRLPAPQRRGVAYARDLRDRGDDGGHALRREHADDADDRLAARGRAAGAGGVAHDDGASVRNVIRAISSSSFVGITRTATLPRLMRRSSLRAARFSASSSSMPRKARRLQMRERIAAECSPMPAVNVSASTPPSAAVYAPTYFATR